MQNFSHIVLSVVIISLEVFEITKNPDQRIYPLQLSIMLLILAQEASTIIFIYRRNLSLANKFLLTSPMVQFGKAIIVTELLLLMN
jgi:hypothetical protein